MDNIIFRFPKYEATFSPETGWLISYKVNGIEILEKNAAQSLFDARLYARDNSLRYVDDIGASHAVTAKGNSVDVVVKNVLGAEELEVAVHIAVSEKGLSYTAKVINNTEEFVEQFACPCVCIHGVLQDEPTGYGKIFTAKDEGVVFSDSRRLNNTTRHITDPSAQVEFYYPGYITMQYMAYMLDEGGLYVAAHDTKGMPKVVTPLRCDDGLIMQIGLFACVAPKTVWEQDFPVVLYAVEGTWESAAEEYRSFIEAGEFKLPPKVAENDRFPEWVRTSPVEVIYPPRSVRGTGYYGPNEFFPYVNGIKYLDDLKDDIDSNIVTMMPYWEGSAPWAPPFIWPPYGGEDMFIDYVNEMHEHGHYVGLYGSGINWTDQHNLVTSYDMRSYRKKHGLTNTMCLKHDQKWLVPPIGGIREGSVMCPSCTQAHEIALDQAKQIFNSHIDFYQFFDQHHGGSGFPCYSREHAHPACFGRWNSEMSYKLAEEMDTLADTQTPERPIISAEGAACDFYSRRMFLNDLRWQSNYLFGEIVPAYSYVMHEYTIDFMGNQAGVDTKISRSENPDSILFALAYSFAAGYGFTLNLKSGGEIHYDWGMSWLHPGPRQAPVKKLTRNLNKMRRGAAKRFLIGGRMLPDISFEQPGTFVMTRTDGTPYVCKEVLSSTWQNGESKAQVFANFRHEDITITINYNPKAVYKSDGTLLSASRTITVPALDCIMAEII